MSTGDLDAALGPIAGQVAAWLAEDPDPATRLELTRLLADGEVAEVRDRFEHPLEFGTAGLRAALGAGPARMNRLVVRRTSAGLARFVLGLGEDAARAGVVVGRDARHGSAEFAADTAAVLASSGVEVHAFARPLPTPLTAFAVRHLRASAGVMVTASHNPAPDNGYKVYAADGAQVIPPQDAQIAADAAAGPTPDDAALAGAAPGALDEHELLRAYRDMAVGLLAPDGPRQLRVVYTPVHGVGGAVLPALLAEAGFEPPTVVPEQAEADPDFPTAPFPNPEEPGVLDLALALARVRDADAVLANDPDADRLAIAVPARTGGAWKVLSGDELGILLAEHVLGRTKGPGRLVATSIVSSSMLSALAAQSGVGYVETLTGFKWVARAASGHPGARLVFGYEEALGYSVTDAVADKDGLSAALVVAEMLAGFRAEGSSAHDHLDALASRLGVHLTSQWSLRLDGSDATSAMAGVVERWRTDPPATLGGVAVSEVVDLAGGSASLPPTDAVVVRLSGAGRVVVRPSGTEPKLKIYFEVVSEPPGPGALETARAEAGALLERVKADVVERSRPSR